MLERILPGASNLQNYHPLLVHFPIAFIYGASLMYFLGWITASEKLQWTALWMLMLGALGAAAALISGFYAAPGLMISQSVRDVLLRHHKHLMVATSIQTGVLAVWALATRPMPTRFRYVFLVGLLAVMLLLTAGADLGGEMVFAYNAAGSACAQPIDLKK
ncbi:MAG: DUF2231 domain-containing protein [Candidatus Binatus sp.]|uniref:DUF2231 domain-containing protein n=1 Tax=Candidatus Binatus sp. TaxID=2811406 RepID=UPI003C736BCF